MPLVACSLDQLVEIVCKYNVKLVKYGTNRKGGKCIFAYFCYCVFHRVIPDSLFCWPAILLRHCGLCSVTVCMISSASKLWLLWGFSDTAAAQFISDAVCIVSDIRISAAGRCNAFCDVPGDKVSSVVAKFHAFVDSSVTLLVQFCVRLFGGRGCNFYSLWFRVLKKKLFSQIFTFFIIT